MTAGGTTRLAQGIGVGYTGGISYHDRIAECNQADLGQFVPWRIGGAIAGHLRRDRVPWLLQHAPEFAAEADGVVLRRDGFDASSAALATVAAQLLREGRLSPPRGEYYAVARDFAEPPRARIDRSAVEWFGVRPFGVHLNGYVRAGDGLLLWIAERARGKPSYPGRLDNLVAGGQPLGLTLLDNLVKECGEEAGMPASLASQARLCSTITYVQQHDAGLKPDTLFCYDLELDAGFAPHCTDGEVERFHLLPLPEVLAIVRDTQRFKPNCNLVVLDFALRHGGLDGELDAGARARLDAALRRPLP